MSWNPFKRLSKLVAGPSTDVGEVVSLEGYGVVVELIAGGQVRARGMTVALGDFVYVRNGVIEGLAPNLSGTEIEV